MYLVVVLSLVLIQNIAAQQHPFEFKNNRNEVQPSSVGDCDNIQTKVCHEEQFKERVKKLETIQEDLKEILEITMKKVHGGEPLDLIRKALTDEGFRPKKNIPKNVALYSLIPRAFHKQSPEEMGIQPPTEESVFDALGEKYIQCMDKDAFSKKSDTEKKKIIEELKLEIGPLLSKVNISSQIFTEMSSINSTDESDQWNQECKKEFTSTGFADQLAYIYDRADFDESARLKLSGYYETYLKSLYKVAGRVIDITKNEFRKRKNEKIDIWALQELHRQFYGEKKINDFLSWETRSHNPVIGLSFPVTNYVNIQLNDEQSNTLKEELLKAFSNADTKMISTVLRSHINNDIKDKKIIDYEISKIIELRKSNAGPKAFKKPLEDLLAKLRNTPERNSRLFDLDFQHTFDENIDFNNFLYTSFCNKRNELISQHVNEVIEKTFSKMSLARPIVEAVTEYFYSPENLALQNELFKTTKNLQLEVLRSKILPNINDPDKRDRITKKFHDSMLGIPPQPDKLTWDQGELPGVQTLNIDSLDIFDAYYINFVDPELRGFTEVNAFYVPEIKELAHMSKKVFMFPGSVQLFKDKPIALEETFAHEIAHSIDPISLRQSGIDVGEDYKSLLDCLSSKSSVAARKDQLGECFADWMSTEVMALKIKNAQPEDRQRIVKEAASFYCFSLQKSDLFERAHEDTHLTGIRRLNGIFGAHPIIREALGCPLSGAFKYCRISEGQ